MKYLSQRNGYHWLRIKSGSMLLPYLPIDTRLCLHSLGKVNLAEAESKAHPLPGKVVERNNSSQKVGFKYTHISRRFHSWCPDAYCYE